MYVGYGVGGSRHHGHSTFDWASPLQDDSYNFDQELIICPGNGHT
jgi:hypothetical protein